MDWAILGNYFFSEEGILQIQNGSMRVGFSFIAVVSTLDGMIFLLPLTEMGKMMFISYLCSEFIRPDGKSIERN